MGFIRSHFERLLQLQNKTSLNNILYAGPKLHYGEFVTLLNFRLFAISYITADISHMYRQLKIQEEHRRYKQVYEIFVAAFGVISSPYLALQTMC